MRESKKERERVVGKRWSAPLSMRGREREEREEEKEVEGEGGTTQQSCTRRVINICFRSPPPAAVIRKRGISADRTRSGLCADWFRTSISQSRETRANDSLRVLWVRD